MRALLRKGTRLALTGLLIASFAAAALNGWRLWHSPAGSLFVERGAEEISARLERLLAREVTPEALDRRLTELLAATPRDWAAIDALSELAREQGVSPSEPVLAAVAAANAEDRGLVDKALHCSACAWDPANCDLSAIALCQVAVAVLPFGDVVSIARESGHMIAGQEVDEVDLTLSTIGLAATIALPATAGASGFVKGGAGLVRAAYRIGALSEPLLNVIRRAGRGVDWARLSKVWPGPGASDEIVAAVNPRLLREATELLDDAGGLVKSVGTRDAIFLLSKAEKAEDTKVLARAAEPLGKRAAGTAELTGMKRLRGIVLRVADEAIWLASSALSAFLALAGLGFATLKSIALRLLRRLAR